MTTVQAGELLANGLSTQFVDTYQAVQNRVAESAIGKFVDLNIKATNRTHEFAYLNSAPHMEHWRRGDSVPTDMMDSVGFTATAHTWARRIPWHKEDRKDDQTNSLYDMARTAGSSAALLPARFAFDAFNNTANTLPSIPNAPDGVSLFNANDGAGNDRFGVSGGNIVSGSDIWDTTAATVAAVYEAIERFKGMKDGKGQPLWTDDVLEQGFLIIHPHGRTQEMDEAFIQRRQGSAAGGAPSNVFQDASRDFELFGTQRLTTDNLLVTLKGAPKKPLFLMDREGVTEQSSLEGDNNSDHTRNTGEEYVQFERRCGLGIALPYGIIEVQDS